jgi:hypothetical protein
VIAPSAGKLSQAAYCFHRMKLLGKIDREFFGYNAVSSFLNSGYRQSGAPRHDKSRWNA